MDEQSIFLEALEKTTPEEVTAWLDASCGEDRQLRDRVEALLRRHREASDFLEQPVDEMEPTCLAAAGEVISSGHASVLRSIGERYGEIKGVALQDADGEFEDPVVQPSSPQVPKTDGDSRYQFLGEIARGGMGAVIKGRDTDLGRDLAVKVLLDEHRDKPEVVQRFVEEAQIGGQLQHPGIAPVYELNQFADRRPFFTMKLVKGKTLAALLSQRENPDQDQAKLLGIFEQVCQTMAYAHSRNVIHRDLKPANIMVGAFGEVQVMDWGLAKVLQTGGTADETKAANKPKDVSIIETIRSGGSNTFGDALSVGSQTQAGSVMGTPAYMPPEQALGETDTLDERADVFGLGAILCEVLTGSPPYVADEGREILRMAMRGDLAECHSRLKDSDADPELIVLVQKCLAADPAKRLKTAGVVSEQVTNHLESVARKLKQAEVRRKLTYVVAASLLLLVTALGVGGVWLQAQQTELQAQETEAANQVAAAERQRAQAEQENNEELQQALYASELQLASAELAAGNVEKAIYTLASYVPGPGAADRRGFEWHYLNRLCLQPSTIGHVDWGSDLFESDLSRDWKRILRLSALEQDDREIRCRLVVADTDTKAEIWSTEVTRPAAADDSVRVSRDISPDGGTVYFYTHSNNASHLAVLPIDIWDMASGEHHRIELHDVELGKFPGGDDHFVHAYFSPDGHYFAVEHRSAGSIERTKLVVWTVGDTEPLYSTELDVGMRPEKNIQFSPDGSKILILSSPIHRFSDELPDDHGRMLILDTQTGKQLHSTLLEPYYLLTRGTFSPDGSLIAATGSDMTESEFPTQSVLWIWDANTGNRLRTICPKSRFPYGPLLFSSDNRIVFIPQSGELFEARSGAALGKLAYVRRVGRNMTPEFFKFHPDGRSIVAVANNGDLLRWPIPSPRFEPAIFHHGGWVFVSADGTHAGRIQPRVFQPEAPLHIYSIDGTHRTVDIPSVISREPAFHAFSHDCRLVALSTERVNDSAEKESSSSEQTNRAVEYEVTLWEIKTGKQAGTLWSPLEHEQILRMSSVPNRGLMAGVIQRSPPGGAATYQLLIWDLATLATRTTVELADFDSLAFSHDGKTVAIEAVADDDATSQLTIYRVNDGAQLKQFPIRRTGDPISESYIVERLVFNHEGSAIAALCPDEECIDIWDVKTGSKRRSLHGITTISTFAWSAAGDRIIAFEASRTLKTWDTETGRRLLVHADHGNVHTSLRLLPDGERIVGWSRGGPPRIWDATSRGDE